MISRRMMSMSRQCQFCDLSVPGDSYSNHLSSVHNMNVDGGDGEHIQRMVKCMFCLSQMLESEMAGHVFYHHRISGLFLGPGTRAVSSSTRCVDKHVQTDDNHDDTDDKDPDNTITIPDTTANVVGSINDDQSTQDPVDIVTDEDQAHFKPVNIVSSEDITSKNYKGIVEDLRSQTVGENKSNSSYLNTEFERMQKDLTNISGDINDNMIPSQQEIDEADIDNEDESPFKSDTEKAESDDESDFEMECLFCDNCDFCKKSNNQTRATHNINESQDISEIINSDPPLVEHSKPISIFQESPDTNDNDIKSTNDVMSRKKTVTFADITNFYPVKKQVKSKSLTSGRTRRRNELILGPNTSLKYLKYWGITNKPEEDVGRSQNSDIRKWLRRKSSTNEKTFKLKEACVRISKEESEESSLRNLGVVWRCPHEGCLFKGEKLTIVRQHFSSHR